jgi:hypothetical protein
LSTLNSPKTHKNTHIREICIENHLVRSCWILAFSF